MKTATSSLIGNSCGMPPVGSTRCSAVIFQEIDTTPNEMPAITFSATACRRGSIARFCRSKRMFFVAAGFAGRPAEEEKEGSGEDGREKGEYGVAG